MLEDLFDKPVVLGDGGVVKDDGNCNRESITYPKVSLVVLFCMHALRSSVQTRAVIAVTIFWFVVVTLALTFSDYFTRGLTPDLPRH